MLKRISALALALMLMYACAAAGALNTVAPLEGVAVYPEGAAEETAVYVYRYSYPQVEATDESAAEAAETINALYQYLVSDAVSFKVPMYGGMMPEGEKAETVIETQVTCSSELWYSVLVRTTTLMMGDASEVYSAQVFATSTDKPGNVITLPYLLGLLAEDESDTWLQDRQTEKANECVRQFVWAALNERAAAGEITLAEEMDYEWFTALFNPEEEFYLDERGEPVFFVQPGMVCDVSSGLLLFPLTIEEIEDEL